MIARLYAALSRLRREHAAAWWVVPVLVAVLSAALAAVAVGNLRFLVGAEYFVEDSAIQQRPYGEAQDKDIVIVAITEDTLSQFPYRSPVDRAFVSDLLKAIAAKGPRAIGIDLLFDQKTDPAKDAELHATLRALKVPLAVTYVDDRAVVSGNQLAFLDDFVPKGMRAYANIGTDRTDTVRFVEPGGTARDGRYVPSLARALAAKAGVATPAKEVPIVWHFRPDDKTAPFKEYPAHTVPFLPAAWFKDKIVLIGTDITLVDRHRTPFAILNDTGDASLAGVVIQAHALSQLLNHRTSPLVPPSVNFLIAFALALFGAVLGALGFPLVWRAAAAVAAVALFWFIGLNLPFYAGILIGLVAPTLAAAASFGTMESLSGSDARRQREFIKGAFARYISPKLVEQLVRNPERMTLEGERREMTFLFTDVKDFTTMSEQLDSRTLARVLNAYLEGMTGIVLAHDGMVDKFIGDAVFAIFGAPVDLPGHAEKAVRCALAIDRFAQDFHEAQTRSGVAFGLTRIGVHTGSAVIGNFGSSTRFTYTAQGDAVNTASRLEALNKHFGTRICVSAAAKDGCPHIVFRPMASVVLKGKSEAVDVFEPAAESGEALERYADAYARMRDGAPEALALFASLVQEAPDDPLFGLHLGRLRAGARGATVVMTEK